MSAPLSRRRFLQGASVLGAATALGACTDGRAKAPAAASSTTTAVPLHRGDDGTLVVVTLYGGNDALNTVAPVNDPLYRSMRGTLALDPAVTHDIGEGFALHPALARCKALWDDDRLAVVHGVGFDGLDRSHFHCMDVWQAGGNDPGTGWLGRWLDAVGAEPIDAVAVGRGLPLLVRGQHRSAAVIPPGPFELPGNGSLDDLLATLSRDDRSRPELGGLVAGSTADLLSVAARVAPVVADTPTADTLAARFETLGTLIESGLPTRVYATAHDGFDTHSGQAATHQSLLADLDAALGAFLDRMGARPVTVLIYSEFGRRVVPNASGGTDHGRAGTVVIAGTVQAGHHGEPPPLDRLVDGDLATTVDYRAVYGGVLEGVLGIDARDVLDDPPPPLSVV